MVLMDDVDIALLSAIVVAMYVHNAPALIMLNLGCCAFVGVVAECAIVNIHTLLLKYHLQTPKQQPLLV